MSNPAPKLNPVNYGWTDNAGFRWLEIDDIERANADAGGHWFDAGSMRFFSSRIGQNVYQGPGGYFFTTSEQNRGMLSGYVYPRLYSVRQFHLETGDVDTVGTFQGYATAAAARRAAEKLAKGGAK